MTADHPRPQLRVDVKRIRFFVACPCGWEGQHRLTALTAEKDLDDHLAQVRAGVRPENYR